MLNARQCGDERHSVVPFQRPGPVRPTRCPHTGRTDISSLLSLAEYERSDEENAYRHCMILNGLGFVVIVAVIAAGVWLMSNLSG